MKKSFGKQPYTTGPLSAANFLAAWRAAALGVPFQSATSEQVYRLYTAWCALTAEAYPLQHTVLSEELIRLCDQQGIAARVKVMALKLDADKPKARMFLIQPPPPNGQGKWAAQLAAVFEAHLQAAGGMTVLPNIAFDAGVIRAEVVAGMHLAKGEKA